MSDVHIPFVKALQEGISDKMLPDGMLSYVRNMRIRKDGRLESRYGYPIQSNLPAALMGGPSRLFKHGTELVAITPRTSATGAAKVLTQISATQWITDNNTSVTGATTSSTLGDTFAGVTRFAVMSRAARVASSDCVVDSSGYAWVAVAPSGGTAYVYRIDPSNGAVLTNIALTTSAQNVKLVLCGTNVVAVWTANNSTLSQTVIDTSTYATTSATVMATGITYGASFADVAPYSATQYLLAVQTATSPAAVIQLHLVTVATGATASQFSATMADAHTYHMGVSTHPTLDMVLVVARQWSATSGHVVYATVRKKSDFSLVVALGPIDSTGYSYGAPLAGYSATGVVVGVNYFDSSAQTKWAILWTVTASPVMSAIIANNHFVSRPTTVGTGVYAWAMNLAGHNFTNSVNRTYYLIGTRAGSACATHTCEAIAAQFDSYGGQTEVDAAWDQRRNIAVLPSGDPLCVLPVYGTYSLHGADLFRVDTSRDVGRAVHINGQSILPGAIVREWSGSQLVESGLLEGPRDVVASEGLAGNVDVGTHQYVVVWEWRDEQGRIHRSPPSIPAPVTVASSTKHVTVTFDPPPISSKGTVLGTEQVGVFGAVYRTLVGGNVFYYVGSVSAPVNRTSDLSFDDNLADATVAVNSVLYTQGARGALSGILPNDAPPAARYACASGTRVMLGGLENPSQVQWSKLAYPGEPIQWSIDPAYKATVDGVVTGVAVLDGTWIVFTRDSVWEISGDGPDDTGNGSFSEPRKRPSTTGCISHRSIIETADGVMFQGTNGGLWLLPRGGNAPVWIGQPVRETMASYPNITSASRVDYENCIYWNCSNVWYNERVLVVYDTRNNEWYVDSFPVFGYLTAEHGDALSLSGIYKQSRISMYDAASTAIVGTVITGDIRPFGASGWGRLRMVHLLGEQRTVSPVVGTVVCSVSYDSGLNWTDTFTFDAGLLTLEQGEALDLQFGPSIIRNTAYRFRFVLTPSAGVVSQALTALSLDLYKSPGVRRVEAERRG